MPLSEEIPGIVPARLTENPSPILVTGPYAFKFRFNQLSRVLAMFSGARPNPDPREVYRP